MAPCTRSNPNKKSVKFETSTNENTDFEEDKKSFKSKTVKKANKAKRDAKKSKNKIKNDQTSLSKNDLGHLTKEVDDTSSSDKVVEININKNKLKTISKKKITPKNQQEDIDNDVYTFSENDHIDLGKEVNDTTTSSKIIETADLDSIKKKPNGDVALKKPLENETSFSKNDLCSLSKEENSTVTVSENLKIKTDLVERKAKSKKDTTSKKKQSGVGKKRKEKLKIQSEVDTNQSISQKLSKNMKNNLSAENENVDPSSVKSLKISRKRKNIESDSSKKQNVSKTTKKKNKVEPNIKLMEPLESNVVPEAMETQQKSEEQLIPPTEPCTPEESFASTSQHSSNNLDESCTKCEQKLNQGLKLYSGEPKGGSCEDIAITDKCLLLFDGNEEEKDESMEDNRAFNKITFFEIYCENGHLCSLDSGLIEKDRHIFISGYVKPIYNFDPLIDEKSVAGKDFGPIAEWWTTGFDIGETPTLGISTAIGDYILMQPTEQYKPFYDSVMLKVLLSKLVIEFIVYEPHASYEDLISHLQDAFLSTNSALYFTEEMLLHKASFICDQVISFDDKAEPSEPLLIVTPCLRRLIELAGISFEKIQVRQKGGRERKHRIGSYRKEQYRRLALNKKNPSTALIDNLFKQNNFHASKGITRNRCGKCDRCMRLACKNCSACEQKNFAFCPKRRCFWTEVQEENTEDLNDTRNISTIPTSLAAYHKSIGMFTLFQNKLSWIGSPIAKDSGNTYYDSIQIDDQTIESGDYVSLRSTNENMPSQIVKVAYMWEDASGIARFHANYLWRGQDTVLGEMSNKKELFYINRCSNVTMSGVKKKVEVKLQQLPRNWFKTGDDESDGRFFCEKSYEPTTGTFYDLSAKVVMKPTSDSVFNFCASCERFQTLDERRTPKPIEPIETKNRKTIYGAVLYMEQKYNVGSCVYLKPQTFRSKSSVNYKNIKHKDPKVETIDEEKYPEYFRKSKTSILDQKHTVSIPLDVGYISEIFTMNNVLSIKVKKLYRPENTCLDKTRSKQMNLNELFWSNDEQTVLFSEVIGKFYLIHEKTLTLGVNEWSTLGPDRFFFSKSYKENNKNEPASDLKELFSNIVATSYETEDVPKEFLSTEKLKTLDLYGGCGGLSLGLRQAGIADSCWAIEPNKHAASTYKKNSPETVVFVEDCDVILDKILKGETKFNNQCMPLKKDVELLCTSLPCDDFKMMDTSTFKKSKIAIFLSFLQYYKPSYFVLESNEKLIQRDNVFKWTLIYLINIGYQVSFDLMQIGCYGAPRNEKRFVILGAAPGNVLPKFPNYLHAFPKSLCQSAIVVDNKKYTRGVDFIDSAPYRAITVQDAISDLPLLNNDEEEEHIFYYGMPKHQFQKSMRLDMLEPVLFNHVCKSLDPLTQARVELIPDTPTSDWRDLPNIEFELSDGNFTKKLIYNYDDKTVGKSSTGALRGVCSCASGESCDPKARQQSTLIPWHLVHSANKNSNWKGLYGRLDWDGFFGAVTIPLPTGKKGPVLHPTQPRLVSVRECARSKGFPDDFEFDFDASIEKKYLMIAKSASPLLGRALGHEIARAREQPTNVNR